MKAWGNRCLPKATQNVRVPARHRPEHVCPPAKWTEGDTDAPRPAPNSGPGAEPGQDPGSQGLASGQVAWDPPVSSQVTDGDSHTADDRAREPTALLVQRSCPGPVQTSSPFLSPRALPSPPLSSSPLLSSPLPSCPPLHSPPFPSSPPLPFSPLLSPPLPSSPLLGCLLEPGLHPAEDRGRGLHKGWPRAGTAGESQTRPEGCGLEAGQAALPSNSDVTSEAAQAQHAAPKEAWHDWHGTGDPNGPWQVSAGGGAPSTRARPCAPRELTKLYPLRSNHGICPKGGPSSRTTVRASGFTSRNKASMGLRAASG